MLSALLAVNLGPPGADAPARGPQLAVNGSTVALVFGAGKAIYFSASRDSGRTFSAPVKVAEAAILPLSRHRGPRIAFAKDAILVTAVTGNTPDHGPHAHGLPSDGDLRLWASKDGGQTWTQGPVLNEVPGAASEGLHALAADDKGVVWAVWLDKRSAGTRLYGARSGDSGVAWSRNVLVYESPGGSICQCCHPSLAIGPEGEAVVMWRNVLGGARDLYLTRSREDRFADTPQKLGKGRWELNACPMDGGGLALVKGRAVTAWRRERTIYLARPGEEEIPIGEGTDVALAAGPAGPYALWSTPQGIRALPPNARDPLSLSSAGAFPSIAVLSDGSAIAAWESAGSIAIHPVR
jgi:hypothetical protein